MAVQFYAPEVAEGEFLGDYQVLGVLGRGPTGTTYHVMSNVLGKEFALKALHLTPDLPLEWIDRLEAQIAVLSKLNHCYVDRIINSGRSGRFWFCLKDFVHDGEGEACNLRGFLEKHRGQLSSFQTWHLMEQLLSALREAAQYQDAYHQGLFHGNLKPENILVTHSVGNASFELRVSDFQPYGLLCHEVVLETYTQWLSSLDKHTALLSERAVDEALTSIYRGYDYLAPEWTPGGKASLVGDIYSLGVLAYEMLTGQLPAGSYAKPSQIQPEIPEAWDRIINSCLHSHPELRYQSYCELQEDLMELAPEMPEQPSVEPLRERRSITPIGMVYIPRGTSIVGSSDCGEDAYPPHEVQVAGFYMDRHPVTNAQFAEFVKATDYVTEAERGAGGPIWVDGEWKVLDGVFWGNPTGHKLPQDFFQHPVTQISLADAQAYCEWKGRRLPTECEWEYAARGGQGSVIYPWGNTISRLNANFSSDSTTPVMAYSANGYGLYDVAGNVWEWTESWYQPYAGSPHSNPHFGEKYRVVRGGAWMYDGGHCQLAYRNANQPERCYPTLGFRTVSDSNAGGEV